MSDPNVYARDLKPGMTVPMRNKIATVKAVTTMDGKNGNRLELISDIHPTSPAIRIDFHDFETVIAHPWAVVVPAIKH